MGSFALCGGRPALHGAGLVPPFEKGGRKLLKNRIPQKAEICTENTATQTIILCCFLLVTFLSAKEK